jgi:hypothetical protein
MRFTMRALAPAAALLTALGVLTAAPAAAAGPCDPPVRASS